MGSEGPGFARGTGPWGEGRARHAVSRARLELDMSRGRGPPHALSLGAPTCTGEPRDSPGRASQGTLGLGCISDPVCFERSFTLSGPLSGSRVKPGTRMPPRAWDPGRRQALTGG